MKGTANELQEVSLVALINDPYILSKCASMIEERFYQDPAFKLIFKAIKSYYDKYNTVPSKKELSIGVKESHREEYGDIDKVLEKVDGIYSAKFSSEDFLYEKTVEFIKKYKIEQSLYKTVEYLESGEIDLDKVALDLREGLDTNLSKAKLYRLSDTTELKEIKEEFCGSNDSPMIIKFFIDQLNPMMQYKGIVPGTVTLVVAPPGRGKTTFLINQGLAAAKQGFTSLHIFLGDMKRYDGILRYLSCLSGVPTSVFSAMTTDDLEKEIRKYNMSGFLGNVYVLSHAAEEMNTSSLLEEIINLQKRYKIHFNQIIIDYDENLAKDNDSMYESGGSSYNKVALFATVNKSVVFIAAQPKPSYWGNEVIPLEAAAESSKKQKIIDMMLTIGKPNQHGPIGTLNVAKNRRGTDGRLLRLKFDGDNARVSHISEDEYQTLKSKDKFENKVQSN